jgi:hypothetical protein
MVNPFKDTDWSPSTAARRKFAKSWAIGFPIIAAVFAVLGLISGRGVPGWTLWLGAIGGALGVLLHLLPQIARPFYLAWYFLACCIGIVVSNALLIAFFYLVITPFGLVMRAFGRDPLKRAWDPDATSYWREAEKSVDQERYFRQF